MGKDAKAPTVEIETVLIVRPLKVSAAMCGVLGAFLLLLSIGATAWLSATDHREGLFEKCNYNHSIPDYIDCGINPGRGDWIMACQGLCLISIFICVIAVVVTAKGLNNTDFKVKYKLYYAGLCLFFLAVMFELISLVVFPIKFLEEVQQEEDTNWGDISFNSFGWAYIVGWVGAVAEFTAGLLLLLDRGAEEIVYRERVIQEDGIEESV